MKQCAPHCPSASDYPSHPYRVNVGNIVIVLMLNYDVTDQGKDWFVLKFQTLNYYVCSETSTAFFKKCFPSKSSEHETFWNLHRPLLSKRVKGDWDFRLSDLVKNPDGTDI